MQVKAQIHRFVSTRRGQDADMNKVKVERLQRLTEIRTSDIPDHHGDVPLNEDERTRVANSIRIIAKKALNVK